MNASQPTSAKSASPCVFLVEDDVAFSDAVVLSLESAEIRVRAFACADEFLDAYRSDAPGCLVTDVRMPGMNGLELQQTLADRRCLLPIIFVSGHGDVGMSASAFKRGAVDFMQKPFTADALLQSVGEALARDARQRRLAEQEATVQHRYRRLSGREARIMSMVITDRSNKEIARDLGISPRTVEHHREHVMAKMEAHSLPDLVVMGILCGMQELSLAALRRTAEPPERA